MASPVLKGRENFDTFSKQMKVYAKLHGFESVFDNDPYVEVGADENDRETIMAQGVSTSMCERQLMAWVFLKPSSRMLTKQLSTVVRLPGSVGNRYKIGTTAKAMPKRECACGSSITLKSGWRVTR